MSRLIQAKQTQVTTSSNGEAGGIGEYFERVAKLVPVEIIAAYMVLRGFLPASGTDKGIPAPLEIAAYLALVVLTPLYLRRLAGRVPHVSKQLLLATISFVVWSYAIGGPFFWSALGRVTDTQIVYPGVAGLVAVLWSVGLGAIAPSDPV